MPEAVSIVVPCYNEAGNIPDLVKGLGDVLDDLDHTGEVILVDDGSSDDTWDVIRRAVSGDSRFRGIRQMRNFGQSQAYQAGIDAARGAYILLFSGDCETGFEHIRTVVRHLDDGADFVNTRRVGRWGGGSRATKSSFGNALINRISGLSIEDRGSGLKGMRAAIARNIRFYGEMHRFIPDYASLYTDRIIEVDTEFRDRTYGRSAYRGSIRSVSVFLDLITLAFLVHSARRPFLLLPGRIFGFTGLIIFLAGFSVSAWLSLEKVFFGAALSNRPLFLVSILTTILGIVMTMLGMLGEMVMRVYFETGHRRTYLPRETVGDRGSGNAANPNHDG
ncbi:MAG: glycosyltransferase family 2 protein [Opitutales bacterium]